jgi:hypothetical protein
VAGQADSARPFREIRVQITQFCIIQNDICKRPANAQKADLATVMGSDRHAARLLFQRVNERSSLSGA